MKRICIAAIAAASLTAHADITVKFPADMAGKEIIVVAQDIKTMTEAKNSKDVISAENTIKAADKVEIKDMLDTPSRYRLIDGHNVIAQLFAAPGQDISVDLSDPLKLVMKGSPLLEQMSDFESHLLELDAAYNQAGEKGDEAAMQQVIDDYSKFVNSYLESHLDAEVGAYVLTKVDDPELLVASFPKLGDNAKNCIVYPIAVNAAKRAETQVEKDRIQASLTGNAAPDFKLPDLDGNMKSLSDYRGKWVILDFWGSWCPWCIKGFPELKELYTKYAPGELEIIGIDCRESDEAWRQGVKTHDLPWVQLYNSAEAGTESLFGVSGYPTKVIISPEGNVAKIVVGHTSDFTPTLESMMGKKQTSL